MRLAAVWTQVGKRLEPRVVSEIGCHDVGMRILLIEDDRRLSELLAKRLRAEGYEAETCDNGVDGFGARRIRRRSTWRSST